MGVQVKPVSKHEPGYVGPEGSYPYTLVHTQGQREEDVQREPGQEGEEETVVPPSHTVVHPRTVVVEILG